MESLRMDRVRRGKANCPISLVCASCLLVAGSVAPLAAQTSNGTVRGRVADASGAVIPAASVELTSIERGTVTTSMTNDA
jgi:hypothetical protein